MREAYYSGNLVRHEQGDDSWPANLRELLMPPELIRHRASRAYLDECKQEKDEPIVRHNHRSERFCSATRGTAKRCARLLRSDMIYVWCTVPACMRRTRRSSRTCCNMMRFRSRWIARCQRYWRWCSRRWKRGGRSWKNGLSCETDIFFFKNIIKKTHTHLWAISNGSKCSLIDEDRASMPPNHVWSKIDSCPCHLPKLALLSVVLTMRGEILAKSPWVYGEGSVGYMYCFLSRTIGRRKKAIILPLSRHEKNARPTGVKRLVMYT